MRKRKYSRSKALDGNDRFFLIPYKRFSMSVEEDSSSLLDKSLCNDDLSMLESLSQDDGKSLPSDQAYIVDFKLSEDRYKFSTSKNPNSALNIFVNCVEKGFYPPIDVLNFLSEKFKMFLGGKSSLDSSIGFGRRSYLVAKRNIEIVTEIDTLIHYFKLDMSDAVEAVAKRYEQNGIKLEDTSFQDIYNRKGKVELENSLMLNYDDMKWLDAMSEEFRNEKLKELFDTYPEDVKAYIKRKYNLPIFVK